MTYEEVYFKVMGHSPNKEHGVQGAFTWSDIESLMQEAVKNNAVLSHVSDTVCSCSKGKGIDHDEDGKAYCIDCGKYLEQTIP
jgi:hypothetical protein